MNDAIRKADVLIEALSYIRTFRGKLTVIKLGGSAMEDPDALRATLQDVVFMATVGMPAVLVHGNRGRVPANRLDPEEKNVIRSVIESIVLRNTVKAAERRFANDGGSTR